MFKYLLPILLFLPIPILSQSLKDVPLVVDSIGEKKRFTFDFSLYAPIVDGHKEADDIYTITWFCYQGKRFRVRKKFSKASRVRYEHKYYVDQVVEIKKGSYEGATYVVLYMYLHDRVIGRGNLHGFKNFSFECESCNEAEDINHSYGSSCTKG